MDGLPIDPDPLHVRDFELLELVLKAQTTPFLLQGVMKRTLLQHWCEPPSTALVAYALCIGPTLAAKICRQWQEARAVNKRVAA